MSEVATTVSIDPISPEPVSLASSTQLSKYHEGSSELIGFVASESDQVLPSHSAESLSRALSTIPLYLRSRPSACSGTLSKARDISLATRVTLKQSIFTAASIGFAVTRFVKTLRNNPLVADPQSMLDEASSILNLATGARKSLGDTKDCISGILSALDAEINHAEDSGAERWKSALRITTVCATGQSFVTAVLSSIFNSSNPALSQALGVASATISIVGSVGPCLAQWYLERRDQKPLRGDMQGVYIEANHLFYPLSLVHQWWNRLVHSLQTLVTQVGQATSLAIGMYEQLLHTGCKHPNLSGMHQQCRRRCRTW